MTHIDNLGIDIKIKDFVYVPDKPQGEGIFTLGVVTELNDNNNVTVFVFNQGRLDKFNCSSLFKEFKVN